MAVTKLLQRFRYISPASSLVLLALYISVQLRFSASPLSAHIYLSTKSTSPLSVHMPSPYPSTSPSASRPPRDTIPTFLIALTSCPPLGMELLFAVLLRVTVLLKLRLNIILNMHDYAKSGVQKHSGSLHIHTEQTSSMPV